MTVRRWLGRARARAQVTSWTFAGVWTGADTVTVAAGNKSVAVLTGTAVIADLITAVQAALAALLAADYPELAEMTWTKDATHLVATAATPGKPFAATVSTSSAAGTVNGGASSTGTVTTTSAGPNDIGVAANWSGAAVPVNNDTLAIDPDATDDLLYGLDALAAVTGLTVNDTGSVLVGLPSMNEDAAAPYPEYRPQYLQTAGGTVNLGGASGAQSNRRGTDRFKHDGGTVACTWNVYRTGEGRDADLEACLLKGANAANALNVSGQSQVGVAVFGGEAATLLTLRATGSGAFVRLGAAVTLGTVNQDGGVVEVNGAVAAALNHSTAGGTTTVNGAGAVAQVTALGGTVVYNTTGTLGGNTVLMNGAVLDFEQGQGAVAVTNPIDCYSGAVPLDRLRRVNAGGNFVVDYNGFDPGLGLGANVRVTRSAVA